MFLSEIEYLGRRVSVKGILPDSSGLEAVKERKPPSNLQQLDALGYNIDGLQFCD